MTLEAVVKAILRGRPVRVTWSNGESRIYSAAEYMCLSVTALENTQVVIVEDEDDS